MEKHQEEIIEKINFNDAAEWLNERFFIEFLEKDFPSFHGINKMSISPAVKAGENYITVMLRVTIELELKSKIKTTTSYMIKTQPMHEHVQVLVKEWQVFFKEHHTYTKYITAFENYYKNVGIKVKLAPSILIPTKSKLDSEVIILEDLSLKGFKNCDRRLGLDMVHTKAVLQKLAQFHAASAQHFMQEGPYPLIYNQCLSGEDNMFRKHRNKMNKIFLANLDLYGNFSKLEEKLKIYDETQPHVLQLQSKWLKNKFNVLSHGDCWVNNFMFQYDEDGQLKETLFIDLQMSRYGSPAQDLYYFLLSSTNLEIKLKYFDYFISYYHQQLSEHLKLLSYKGQIPLLRDIHMDLFKHHEWAYFALTSVMPVVLSESRDDADLDNWLSDENNDFKISMYTNEIYVKNMNVLIPWLDNRGAFDI